MEIKTNGSKMSVKPLKKRAIGIYHIFSHPLQNRGSRVRILLPLPQGSETRCFRLFFLAFFCFFGAFCSGMTGNREQIAILSSDYCCCRKMSFPNGCNCFFCFECFRLVQHQKSIRSILQDRPRHQYDHDAGDAFSMFTAYQFLTGEMNGEQGRVRVRD